MELTQEYFDKGISRILDKVVTKEEFGERMKSVDGRLSKIEYRVGGVESRVGSIESRAENIESAMATKDDLKSMEDRLIGYTHQAFETQQTWLDYRFDELVSKYDVRERVAVLEREVKELKLKN